MDKYKLYILLGIVAFALVYIYYLLKNDDL